MHRNASDVITIIVRHYATKYGSLDLNKYMVVTGADPTLKNQQKKRYQIR